MRLLPALAVAAPSDAAPPGAAPAAALDLDYDAVTEPFESSFAPGAPASFMDARVVAGTPHGMDMIAMRAAPQISSATLRDIIGFAHEL